MYEVLVDNVRKLKTASLVSVIKWGKFWANNHDVDVLYCGKPDELRIVWSTQRGLIGSHGKSYGKGDCVKSRKRLLCNS
jgi:hypothetical protein